MLVYNNFWIKYQEYTTATKTILILINVALGLYNSWSTAAWFADIFEEENIIIKLMINISLCIFKSRV